MKAPRGCLVAVGLLGLLASSCEDEEMVAKSRAQQARIAELEAQVETLQTSVKDTPGTDPAAELKATEAELQKVRDTIESLQAELETAKAENEAVRKEFMDYKTKYVISD